MFQLNLVTPEKKVVAGEELVDIVLPAHAGELEILPGHAPLMTTLHPGILRYTLKNGESKKLAISWGYCQVSAQGVNVLAELAVEKDEVEAGLSKAKLAKEEDRLGKEFLNDQEWEKVQHEIARLKAEIQLKEGLH